MDSRELQDMARTTLVSRDEYAQHRPLIEEIVNWYMTMREESSEAKQWYHTIDLGNGRITDGMYDHRPFLKYYGFPDSLEGKRVLDIGPGDGFFSFWFEKAGAKEVVAVDAYENPHLIEAKNILGSRIDYRIVDVYDVNPKDLGCFDMIFCGTLLMHLSDPFRALSNIQNMISDNGVFFLAAVFIPPALQLYLTEHLLLKAPVAKLIFGRESLGSVASYWIPSERCLKEMLYKAGFNDIRKISSFVLRENYKLRSRKSAVFAHVVFKAR